MDRRGVLGLGLGGVLLALEAQARLRLAAGEPVVVPLSGPVQPQQLARGSDGAIWFAALRTGAAGRLDPQNGEVTFRPLGTPAKPRGLVAGPDGRLYVFDQSQDVIHAIDPASGDVERFPMPVGTPYIELATGAFDAAGALWFTGYGGWFGRLEPRSGTITVQEAPGGRGPLACVAGPDDAFWFISTTANLLVRVGPGAHAFVPHELPTQANGAKGLAMDGQGHLWVSGFSSGTLSRFEPERGTWTTWPVAVAPRVARQTERPKAKPYAVVADDAGVVHLSDVAQDRILRFDSRRERFDVVHIGPSRSSVRHMLRVDDTLWLAESATDRLVGLPLQARPA
jgi:virginiamycin B lyase